MGTLQVTSQAQTGAQRERVLVLKDVPEPERLAAWIQVKRSGVE
ncbi:hypothetical protein [Hyalangium sp.]|nr:hypothetical protein [Hyalangium sp.]HYI01041.1 hypothetical protein [Hyalangium sp.]